MSSFRSIYGFIASIDDVPIYEFETFNSTANIISWDRLIETKVNLCKTMQWDKSVFQS